MEIKHELIVSFGMIKTGRLKNRMTAIKKKVKGKRSPPKRVTFSERHEEKKQLAQPAPQYFIGPGLIRADSINRYIQMTGNGIVRQLLQRQEQDLPFHFRKLVDFPVHRVVCFDLNKLIQAGSRRKLIFAESEISLFDFQMPDPVKTGIPYRGIKESLQGKQIPERAAPLPKR